MREHRGLLVLVTLGGVLGSLGRWGVGETLPHPWGTVVVNVTGALLLGVLTAWTQARRVRAFLGIGVLGGWTTFSTSMLDTRDLLTEGRVPTALLLYLGGTLVLGLSAAWAGLVLGRLVRRGRRT